MGEFRMLKPYRFFASNNQCFQWSRSPLNFSGRSFLVVAMNDMPNIFCGKMRIGFRLKRLVWESFAFFLKALS
jgi:hypothetical protein